MKLMIVMVLAVALTGSATAEDADSKAIAALVPNASAMRLADWDKLATSGKTPRASDVKSQSLSLILLTLKIPEKDSDLATEFSYSTERIAKPSELAKEISRYIRGAGRLRVALGPVTMIHADRIKNCTCEVDGDKATGTVTYAVPNLYAGQVDYVANREGDKWRLDEFLLPAHKIHIKRAKDGIWMRAKLPAK